MKVSLAPQPQILEFYTLAFSKLTVIRKCITLGACPGIDPKSRGKPGPQDGFEWAVEGNDIVGL